MTSTARPPRPAVPILTRVRGRRKRHRLRWIVSILLVLVVLAAAGLVGAGWYFSSQLLNVTHDPDTYPLRVLAVGGGTVKITRDDSTTRPGTYALVWHGGRADVGQIVTSDSTDVVRRISGNTRGLRVGERARIDIWMYTSPVALGLRYRTVRIPDPLGPMPAWYIPGRSRTWVLLVHGYKSNRTEPLRPLPVLAGLGLPVLDMSYRNDAGAPQSPDHIYHLGLTEWRDVEAGVRYALAHSATNVILYGYSMGGGIVEYFLHHSSYAGRVRAVVLDAPALNWDAVLDLQASHRGLPGFLTAVAKRIVAYRLGQSSLDPLDATRSETSLHAPTLLFQGLKDTTVPITPSAAFARARPDLVTDVTVPGAEHTESWNVNPAAYDARLKSFLMRVLK